MCVMHKKIYKIIPLTLLVLFVFVFILAPNISFAYQPITFIKSPFGWGLIVIMYILAFLFGIILKFIMRKFRRNRDLPFEALAKNGGVAQNIGKPDRLLRVAIGVGLLLWAITTTWSPILIFFSGFAFFEAIFSWCGFYAAIGKNTCPVE